LRSPKSGTTFREFVSFRKSFAREYGSLDQIEMLTTALDPICRLSDEVTGLAYLRTVVEKSEHLVKLVAFTGDVLTLTIGPKIFVDFEASNPSTETSAKRPWKTFDILTAGEDGVFYFGYQPSARAMVSYEAVDDVVGDWLDTFFGPLTPR